MVEDELFLSALLADEILDACKESSKIYLLHYNTNNKNFPDSHLQQGYTAYCPRTAMPRHNPPQCCFLLFHTSKNEALNSERTGCKRTYPQCTSRLPETAGNVSSKFHFTHCPLTKTSRKLMHFQCIFNETEGQHHALLQHL